MTGKSKRLTVRTSVLPHKPRYSEERCLEYLRYFPSVEVFAMLLPVIENMTGYHRLNNNVVNSVIKPK